MRVDLCNLVVWFKEWQMLFNVDKCKVMHLGYNNPKVNYVMETTQLQEFREEKDLGIIVSDDLKWDKPEADLGMCGLCGRTGAPT